MSQSSLLAALVLLGLLSCCTAMQCYVCNSGLEKDCNAETVPDKYLVNCDPANSLPHESSSSHSRVSMAAGANFTFCRKVIQYVPMQNNVAMVKPEATRIIRSCGYVEKDGRNLCKWQRNYGGVQVQLCECDTKACNTATLNFIPAVIPLAIASVAAILLK